MKPRSDLSLSLAALAIRGALRLLGATWRVRVLGGESSLQRLVDAGRPVLFSLWHNQSVCLGWFLYRYLLRRGFPITLFASQSRDGEILARIGRAWGLEAVRGSSSRGGSLALRKLYRAVTRHRSSPVIAVDGPRGPIYECKPGVVVLAQTSGAPVQAIAFAAQRAWRLKSWDRLIIPRPFSRILVVLGEPTTLPPAVGETDPGAAQIEIEQLLHGLTREAERQLDQGSQR